MKPAYFTFGYLTDPVIVGVAVAVVPVFSRVSNNLCTVFIVIVVVGFTITPVLIFGLRFEKYTSLSLSLY